MTMTKKIISAGHICLDITPAFPSDSRQDIEKLLRPGKLLQMGAADIHTGGSVANTGLALKILGADVSLMGMVGDDAFGRLVLAQLQEHQAADGMIIQPGSTTSYSVVLAPPGIDRIFLHCSGSNNDFSVKHIDFSKCADAALFHFGYPPLMKSMYQDNGKELLELFQRIHNMGISTSLDMAAVDEHSEAAAVDWEALLKNLLPHLDFFVPSVEELAYMIDRPRYEEWLKRAAGQDITTVLSVERDIEPLAERLLAWGARVVLIKCGAPGLYLRTNTREYLERRPTRLLERMDLTDWAAVSHFERSYKPDQVLSGTGAGDTSIAAFLHSVTEGCSCSESLQYAAATGASCVAAYDALSGLKPLAALRKRIDDGWEKV